MVTPLSVYSPDCHDITKISLRNEVVCNSVHCRFNNLINDQRQAAQTIILDFLVRENLLLQVLLAYHNVVNHASKAHATYNTLHADYLPSDSLRKN